MDQSRLQKAEALRKAGKQPYASHFDRSHYLQEAQTLKEDMRADIAGRVVLFREMGKMTFATLQDHTGRMQIAFREDILEKDHYKETVSLIDLGDFIGVHGKRFTTQKGEPTILVDSWEMLTKTLRPLPEKWHGLQDQETSWRQRYLDLTSNQQTSDRFLFRSTFVQKLREFYWSQEFKIGRAHV